VFINVSVYFVIGSVRKLLVTPSFGCEPWSLTLREEHRLRVFENRVLRKIFCLKREEVVGGWRRLHNEELHNLYASPDDILLLLLLFLLLQLASTVLIGPWPSLMDF
jgi:hypothetical protein